MGKKFKTFFNKGEIVDYTSGTKEAVEKGTPAYNLKKIAMKVGIVTLACSMALTGCTKSNASDQNTSSEITQSPSEKEQAIEAGREAFLNDDRGLGLTDMDIYYLNCAYNYIVYSQEIYDLKAAKKTVPDELTNKQTAAVKGFSIYVNYSELMDLRTDAVHDGKFHIDELSQNLRSLLLDRLYEKNADRKVLTTQNSTEALQNTNEEKVRD